MRVGCLDPFSAGAPESNPGTARLFSTGALNYSRARTTISPEPAARPTYSAPQHNPASEAAPPPNATAHTQHPTLKPLNPRLQILRFPHHDARIVKAIRQQRHTLQDREQVESERTPLFLPPESRKLRLEPKK